MDVYIIKLADGTIKADGRGVWVLPPDAEISGAFVAWGPQAAEVGDGAVLVQSTSEAVPPTQARYLFDIEHCTDAKGGVCTAPTGQTAARKAIAEDDEGAHTLAEWQAIEAAAHLDAAVSNNLRKAQYVEAVKAAL
ncbi:hypothetical protein HN371_00480 [Candidatus Poribacteria bacterium]|jgi:hypothetical protein|nr:hypothetical protein [Candidatus Poribacteria bacterium]MBT7101167.1 hypothetical protein [Candidatus Poribacteria bacterium]